MSVTWVTLLLEKMVTLTLKLRITKSTYTVSTQSLVDHASAMQTSMTLVKVVTNCHQPLETQVQDLLVV